MATVERSETIINVRSMARLVREAGPEIAMRLDNYRLQMPRMLSRETSRIRRRLVVSGNAHALDNPHSPFQ
jgi:hypothetical protein